MGMKLGQALHGQTVDLGHTNCKRWFNLIYN